MLPLLLGFAAIALITWSKQRLDERLDRIDEKLTSIEDRLRELKDQ